MISGSELIESLPVAVYATDAEGRITFYNEAAAAFWGHRPEIGSSRWCGSWCLYWPDGRLMPHDQCPMAIALKEGRIIRDVEAIAERPDGTRVPFIPYPTPLRDSAGRITGAVNLLVDLTERQTAAFQAEHLAAIVSSSDDAIISKTLEGRITSWNPGATRIFGYEADEMIGEPIKQIIPQELHPEEDDIIEKLKRGERIDHYETVRLRKDGRRINISLTVSPLRDRSGIIYGASKVARDITERKRNEALQRLLTEELSHRVKNTLATIQAIASQTLRRTASPRDFVDSFNGRVQALARAHDLLFERNMKGAILSDIVRKQVLLDSDSSRIQTSGPSVILDAKTSVEISLVFHELATNARKHGALSDLANGRLSINWRFESNTEHRLIIEWKENDVPNVSAPDTQGFGTSLIERTLQASGGKTSFQYDADGLACRIEMLLPDVQQNQAQAHVVDYSSQDERGRTSRDRLSKLQGKRIMLIEDEHVIALNIEEQLTSMGCEVVGSAGTVASARRQIVEKKFDAALVDVNLAGKPIDEVAAALIQKGIPFIFATGYGRHGLPPQFQDAPILSKPFSQDDLETALMALFGGRQGGAGVVPLRPKKS